MSAITVFCGARQGNVPVFTSAAQQLGQLAAEHSITIVYGGGRVGLMGVIADAALRAGGHVIGVIPEFLRERELLHPNLTEVVIVDNLYQRKEKMLELADAFVTLPGGIGTLDEFFEVVSLNQLKQLNKPNYLVSCDDYFAPLLSALSAVIDASFADPQALSSITVVDSPAKVIDSLAAQ